MMVRHPELRHRHRVTVSSSRGHGPWAHCGPHTSRGLALWPHPKRPLTKAWFTDLAKVIFKLKMAIKRGREREQERHRERKKNTKYALLAFKNVVVLGYNELQWAAVGYKMVLLSSHLWGGPLWCNDQDSGTVFNTQQQAWSQVYWAHGTGSEARRKRWW